VFRVFATKEEIIEAALDRAFDPEEFLAELATVDAGLPLRERLVTLATLLQDRFIDIFALMTALAVPKPPARNGDDEHLEWRRRGLELMVALLEPDRDAFAVDLPHVVKVLRLLTFSGSHPHITDQSLLTPDEIVDVVLDGTLRKDR
jgi:AcrR family transcriptional regulator